MTFLAMQTATWMQITTARMLTDPNAVIAEGQAEILRAHMTDLEDAVIQTVPLFYYNL